MAIVDLKISVPKSLSGITLRQYQKYLKLLEDNKDADNEFINMKSLEIFCGLSLKDSYNLPVKHFEGILNHLNNCFKEKTPLIGNFILNDREGKDVEFGFIPKLDDISYGEYIDIETFIGDWNNIHKAMAVLYRPVIYRKNELYRIAPYTVNENLQEAMKDMPVNVAMGAIVFFYRLGKKLATYTMDSLLRELEVGMSKEDREHLEKNGITINQYINSLKEMSLESMKLPNYHYISA